jgi:hypothetical protein
MPLSKLQTDILTVLASHRDPESHNRNAPRYSDDVDFFHDREERVAIAALDDAQSWRPRANDITRLEWVVDSDYRFFPTVRDDTFGYVLHPVDLAMNKTMAAAGRREVRDVVDLVTVHKTILPLGALIWAAVEKSPGFTPEGLIAEIRRNAHYPAPDWRALIMSEPVDPADISARLRSALDEAEAFVTRMPTSKMGLLFLQNGEVTQPDPDLLETYETHAGQRRGHWPTNPDIAAAMFERLKKRSI